MKQTLCAIALAGFFLTTAGVAADTSKTPSLVVRPIDKETMSSKTHAGDVVQKSLQKIKGTTDKKSYARPDGQAGDAKNAIPKVPSSILRNGVASNAEKAALQQAIQAKSADASSMVKMNTESKIAMQPGANVYIPISRNHPNRLITPFTHPQVISTSLTGGKKGECGEVCVRDGIIYITTDSTQPVTAFITQKDNEEIAFSVTMLPRAIPPREVHFTLPKHIVERANTKRGNRAGQSSAEAWETEQPYIDTIKKALRHVALQEIPPGYTIRAVKETDAVPFCSHPGLKIDFGRGQILEGHNLDIYVGVITNNAKTPVEFREESCGGWRTAAVTSWPLKVLEPKEETEIYIVTKRGEEVAPDTMRRSLIKKTKH